MALHDLISSNTTETDSQTKTLKQANEIPLQVETYADRVLFLILRSEIYFEGHKKDCLPQLSFHLLYPLSNQWHSGPNSKPLSLATSFTF